MGLLRLIEERHPRPDPASPSAADVCKMTLSDFARSGLLVRVRCHGLGGEEVFFASTEKEAATGRAEGLQVYTAEELAELFKLKPGAAALKTIHEAKRALGVTLLKEED